MPAHSTEGNRGGRFLSALDGQQLRQLRRQHGLSQEKLAGLAGISLTTIARLERQSPAPCRSWTLARLAIALGEHPATFARPQQAPPQELSTQGEAAGFPGYPGAIAPHGGPGNSH
jgi:transcriptional regulator with XRE-family HTH domain